MKATDLMIGDWVQYTYTPYGQNEPRTIVFQVSQIECFPGTGEFFVWGVKEGRVCTVEDLQPIPLTPEILEKNGFIKTTTSWLLRDGYLGVSVQFIRSKWSLDIRNEFAKKDESGRADLATFCRDWFDVIYVHYLQHALRLCGIEKEIKL